MFKWVFIKFENLAKNMETQWVKIERDKKPLLQMEHLKQAFQKGRKVSFAG